MKHRIIIFLVTLFTSPLLQAEAQWNFYSTIADYPVFENDEITLIPDERDNAASTAFYMHNVPSAFILNFEFKVCNKTDEPGAQSSAAGMAVGLGQKRIRYQRLYRQKPHVLSGPNRGSAPQRDGIAIHFSTAGEKGENPMFNSGVFVLGTGDRVISSDSEMAPGIGCEWQPARISLSTEHRLRVYFGARVIETILNPAQIAQIRRGLLTFSAATGSNYSEHAVRDVELTPYWNVVHRFKGSFQNYTKRLSRLGMIITGKQSGAQRYVSLQQEAVLAFDDVIFSLPDIKDMLLENIGENELDQICNLIQNGGGDVAEFDIKEWYSDADVMLADFSVNLAMVNNGGGTWDVIGTISSNLVPAMEYMIDHITELREFQLLFVPGSSDDESNYRALRIMSRHGIDTRLADNGQIFSGGVDFFLAGKPATLGVNPTVGVHPWASLDAVTNEAGECEIISKSAIEYPKDDPAHQMEIQFLKELGIDEDFYWFTLYARPNTSDPDSDIHVMTVGELQEYGFISTVQ